MDVHNSTQIQEMLLNKVMLESTINNSKRRWQNFKKKRQMLEEPEKRKRLLENLVSVNRGNQQRPARTEILAWQFLAVRHSKPSRTGQKTEHKVKH